MTSRRGFMRAGGAAAAGAVALSATGTASAQSDDYDGWLSDTSNYDGEVVDERGSDEVTIEVGVEGNDGPNAFGPPAVRINPGTTVVWEWVEGSHNVVDEDEAFESEITSESGFTFEYTPEETGVIKYFCSPHRSIGMKGVLDVAEGSAESGGGSGGDGGDDGGDSNGSDGSDGDGSDESNSQASDPTEAMGSSRDGTVGSLVVSALVLAFVSPALFATFLRKRDVGERPDDD